MTVGLADERPARTQTIAHFFKKFFFSLVLFFVLFFLQTIADGEGKIYNDTARHTVPHTATIVVDVQMSRHTNTRKGREG